MHRLCPCCPPSGHPEKLTASASAPSHFADAGTCSAGEASLRTPLLNPVEHPASADSSTSATSLGTDSALISPASANRESHSGNGDGDGNNDGNGNDDGNANDDGNGNGNGNSDRGGGSESSVTGGVRAVPFAAAAGVPAGSASDSHSDAGSSLTLSSSWAAPTLSVVDKSPQVAPISSPFDPRKSSVEDSPADAIAPTLGGFCVSPLALDGGGGSPHGGGGGGGGGGKGIMRRAFDEDAVAHRSHRRPRDKEEAQASAHSLPAELAACGFRVVHKVGEGATSVVYMCEGAGEGDNDGDSEEQDENDAVVDAHAAAADADAGAGTKLIRSARYALKVISKTKVQALHTPSTSPALVLAAARAKADLVIKLQHPHIVRTIRTHDLENSVVLVMELMEGGELFDFLEKRGRLSERMASQIAQQVASAVAYCHTQDLMHGDLKPENLLLKHKQDGADVGSDDGDDVPVVKVADFGAAAALRGGTAASGTGAVCGSGGYIAPEVLCGKPYGAKADVWSLGVIFYVMLVGQLPFGSELEFGDNAEVQAAHDVDNALDQIPSSLSISSSARELLRHMLTLDPAQRCTAQEVQEHSWTAGRTARADSFCGTLSADLSPKKTPLSSAPAATPVEPVDNFQL